MTAPGPTGPRALLAVYGALMLLFGLSLGTLALDLGAGGLAAGLLIATAKALLVALWFMHLRHGARLEALAVLVALVLLATLAGLTLFDFAAQLGDRPPL